MRSEKPRVVIIGAGFGGLHAARRLGKFGFPVTLIDKENFHLFQPLLYQVATGFLAPGDIAAPIRSILAKYKSVKVVQDEVLDIDPDRKRIKAVNGNYPYDILIAATGTTHSYFGNDDWSAFAHGLKTINDSLMLRSLILKAFEKAELSDDEREKEKLLTFLIVGAGPTGVELAGALSELTHGTLKNEFRNFDPTKSRIVLCEAEKRVLSTFHPNISEYTYKTLSKLGVEVLTSSFVSDIAEDSVKIEKEGQSIQISASTIIWAAGVKASPLAHVLRKHYKAELDKSGKIKVNKFLNLADFEDIFVIGDLAHFETKDGKVLPGLAPVAMQQGDYVAKLLRNRSLKKETPPFAYFDKGNMAVIGRRKAVAESGKIRLTGLPAWLGWAFIHIYFLIEFEDKLVVFVRWAWNYLTGKRGSRLITK